MVSGLSEASGKKGRKTGKGHCPTCGQKAAVRYRPFCSPRCAEIDLGRWFKGAYRIPTPETPGDNDRPGESAEEEPPEEQGGA